MGAEEHPNWIPFSYVLLSLVAGLPFEANGQP